MPTPQTKTFDVTADFPGGKVNLPNLRKEIEAHPAITTALDGGRIDTSGGTPDGFGVFTGGTVNIFFKDTLSAAEETALHGDTSGPAGGLIAAHNNGPSKAPPQKVEIKEEEDHAVTGGHYGAESVAFDAPANGRTDHEITLPISISLLSARLDPKNVNDGDFIGLDVSPDTVVGVLASDVGATVKAIPVPQSVIDLLKAGTLWVGQHLLLDDSTNKDDCGAITGWDEGAGTVSTKAGTTNSFAAATPTSILITTSMSPGILNSGWVEVTQKDSELYAFGEAKIGGSFCPAGKKIRIRYDNNHATAAARPRVMLEYLY